MLLDAAIFGILACSTTLRHPEVAGNPTAERGRSSFDLFQAVENDYLPARSNLLVQGHVRRASNAPLPSRRLADNLVRRLFQAMHNRRGRPADTAKELQLPFARSGSCN